MAMRLEARQCHRVLTNTHMLLAAKDQGVKNFFYSSSACVYNGEKQTNADVVALKEEDAYPAFPEDGYGWEKLFSNAYPGTLKKISECVVRSRVSTMFTVRMEPGVAAARRPRLYIWLRCTAIVSRTKLY
jgi:hypothetical protein